MKKLYAVLTAICMTALVSCFSPWEGGDGTITLVFGDGENAGNSRSRAIAPLNAGPDFASMTHQIILTGPGGITQTHDVTGGGSFSFAVTPGDWSVTVRAIGAPPIGHDEDFPAQTLRALGFADGPVTVRAGQTAGAEVQMTPAVEISSHALLNELGDILGPDVTEAILVLTTDITAEAVFNVSRDITLISEGNFTIRRADAYTTNLFVIYGGSRLTLGRPGLSGSITLDGRSSAGIVADESLIHISDGTLVMYDGVTLTGNAFAVDQLTYGGAVSMGLNTTFYMRGGTISGNFSMFGGGVVVWDGAHFAMSGGTISGNTADGNGNSVYVWSNGTAIIFGQQRTGPYIINENLP